MGQIPMDKYVYNLLKGELDWTCILFPNGITLRVIRFTPPPFFDLKNFNLFVMAFHF